MTLAEQLILLALHPERGNFADGIDQLRLRRGACAAILAEMVLQRRIKAEGEGIRLLDVLPDYHPLLGESVTLLSRLPQPMVIEHALDRIERGISSLLRRILDNLVARDILHDYRQAFFWHRYPVRSQQALAEARGHLMAAVNSSAPPTASFALAIIADGCGVAAATLPTEARFRMRRHLNPTDMPASQQGDTNTLLRIAVALV